MIYRSADVHWAAYSAIPTHIYFKEKEFLM